MFDIKTSGSRAASDGMNLDLCDRPANPRFDWVMCCLFTWLIGGVYLDGWAHSHRRIETFYTPWHLALYSGFVAAAVGLLLGWWSQRRHSGSWRQAVPEGYGLALIGVGVFIGGGIGDIFWHGFFGFEHGVEALVSPSHLILALGIGLMLTGPLRATRGALFPATTLRAQLPPVISLGFLWAVLQFFTQYAHPFVNTWLVTQSLTDEPKRELVQLRVDGIADLRIIREPNADLGQPGWSPDGKHIVFVSGELLKPETWDLYIMDADGSHRRRLTDNAVYEGHPVWSPDGHSIAFESHQRGMKAVYVMNIDDGEQQRLTEPDEDAANPSFSPDGSMLVYDAQENGLCQIVRRLRDGSARQALTSEGQNRYPAWSPDGRYIAFASSRDGRFQIYRMSADGSAQTHWVVSDSQDDFPSWSPDGRQLAYIAQLDLTFDVMSLSVSNRSQGQEVHNVTADTAREDSQGARVSWSPDSQHLLFGAVGHARAALSSRQALGLAGILFQTAVMMGFVLWACSRGAKPASIAVLLLMNLGLITTQGRHLHPELLLVALALAITAMIWLARREKFILLRYGLGRFAFGLPCLLSGSYLLVLWFSSGVGWSLPMCLGTIVLSGTVGWLQFLLFRSTTSFEACS